MTNLAVDAQLLIIFGGASTTVNEMSYWIFT
jgi:hypothetical protein